MTDPSTTQTYLGLAELNAIRWQDRAHFLSMAARVTRQALAAEIVTLRVFGGLSIVEATMNPGAPTAPRRCDANSRTGVRPRRRLVYSPS